MGAWELPADQRTPFRWFNTAAFARPADYTYGNSGTWVIRGPGAFDLSAFALKEVRVLEKATLQFRVEAFNAANHPNFNPPDRTWTATSTTFGQITSVISSPRNLEFALKFHF